MALPNDAFLEREIIDLYMQGLSEADIADEMRRRYPESPDPTFKQAAKGHKDHIAWLVDKVDDQGREWIEERAAEIEQEKLRDTELVDLQERDVLAEEAQQLAPSRAAQAMADEEAIAASKDALGILGDISREGFTEADRAAIDQAQRRVDQRARAAREAMTQQAEERGIGGSGLAYQQVIGGEQSAAEAASSAANEIAMAAADRRLTAAGQAGGLGQDIRRSSFDEDFSRGKAADAFEIWNKQNLQDVASRNIERERDVSDYNRDLDARNQARRLGWQRDTTGDWVAATTETRREKEAQPSRADKAKDWMGFFLK